MFVRDDETRARGDSVHMWLGHDCDRAEWDKVRLLWLTPNF